MFLLQSHLCKWVSDVRIETCRYQHDIRSELNESIKCLVNGGRMSFGGASRLDRPVEDIAPRRGSRSWITGMLMNGRKSYSIVAEDNILRAVPVMSVKIPDRDALTPGFERVVRGNCD